MSNKTMIFTLTLCLFFLGSLACLDHRNLDGTVVSYLQNGADWGPNCSNGTQQSPIKIESASAVCDSSLSMTLSLNTSVQVTHLHNETVTLKVTAPFGTLKATDTNGVMRTYTALQMHFHAPSEHFIDGVQYPLELHLVHQKSDSVVSDRDLAVVGLMFYVNDTAGANPFIEELHAGKPDIEIDVSIGTLLGPLIDSTLSYYNYLGSLTTPACSERVNWYVMAKPIPITTAQMAVFDGYWKNNKTFANGLGTNRVTQPLNGRVVKKRGSRLSCATTSHVSSAGNFKITAFAVIFGLFAILGASF